LLSKLSNARKQLELDTPMAVNTPYINTIPTVAQPWFPATKRSSARSGGGSGGMPRRW
jgi:pyruvate dehydrogenase complex dehydrogenase (E1) component